MCCTQKSDWNNTSNGCDGTIGGLKMHQCVLPPIKNKDKDCWNKCKETQGPCLWCGGGMCCRKVWKDTSNGCDGTFGGLKMHQCVDPQGKVYIFGNDTI